MDGAGKIAQCSRQGAHQISMDHKSGFHKVPLHLDSWTSFGMYKKRVYYVWIVVCFGWCESRYIYHALSSAVVQYLRHLDVPITDFWMFNFRATKTQSPAQQCKATREVASLASTVSISAVISCRSPSACSSPRHGCCSGTLFAIQRRVFSKFRKTSCSS